MVKLSFQDFFLRNGWLILCVALTAGLPARATTLPAMPDSAAKVLSDSLTKVREMPATGVFNPEVPTIIRHTLTAAEEQTVLHFDVSLKMRHMDELERRLGAGEHISPQEMLAKYDPTEADYDAVTKWLSSEGFSFSYQDKTRLGVFGAGTIGQIQKAFSTTFAIVSLEGKDYPSAITPPAIPANLASAVLGVNHLQTYMHDRPIVQSSQIHSMLQSNAQPGQQSNTYTPPQVVTAYGGNSLYSSGINGAGQTVAIIVEGAADAPDLVAFWNFCGINDSLGNVTVVNNPNYTLPPAIDTTSEDDLDAEWASGTAPGANLRIYIGSATDDATMSLIYADATNTIVPLHLNQVSTSYGSYEDSGGLGTSNASEEATHQYIVQLNSAGITFFCGSGDSGYSNNPSPKTNNDMFYPGCDSNSACVGGTDLYTDSNYNVIAETPWLGTSGGASFVFTRQYWQNENWINTSAGTDAPIGTMRLGPDISAPGGTPDSIIFSGGRQAAVNGTSWSGPTWAAFCALLNQKRAQEGLPSLGLIAPYLYPMLAATSSYTAGNFRDIVPVSGDQPGTSTPYFNGNRSINCRTGYDQVTGIGVPNLAALATALSTGPYATLTPTAAPVLINDPAPTTATVGTPYNYTYVASAYPPATFTLSSGGFPPGLTLDLLSGKLSGTPTSTGTYAGVVSAGNLVGSNATQNFSITVNSSVLGGIKSYTSLSKSTPTSSPTTPSSQVGHISSSISNVHPPAVGVSRAAAHR